MLLDLPDIDSKYADHIALTRRIDGNRLAVELHYDETWETDIARHAYGLLARAEGDREQAELLRSRFHAAVDRAPVGVTVVATVPDARRTAVKSTGRDFIGTSPLGVFCGA